MLQGGTDTGDSLGGETISVKKLATKVLDSKPTYAVDAVAAKAAGKTLIISEKRLFYYDVTNLSTMTSLTSTMTSLTSLL